MKQETKIMLGHLFFAIVGLIICLGAGYIILLNIN